jgi:hypothetical protein
MNALSIHAGPRAVAAIREHGLTPSMVSAVAGAAGGPKGLVLTRLDQWLFGDWLKGPRAALGSASAVHLFGASIGAWRMGAACLADPKSAFAELERAYIHQDYEVDPGRKTPSPEQISRRFADSIDTFFGSALEKLLSHPRYRLHIVTSRGMGPLAREGRWRTPVGYMAAWIANAASRPAMGRLLERVLFSDPRAGLPIEVTDYRTRQVHLGMHNLKPALVASCSIPFVLKAVQDIPRAPKGAYWDGGITDYHLHFNWASMNEGVVIYPHFQSALVPGWLDKPWKRRHRATAFLDNVIVLAPNPAWATTLPNGKLPDRTDFTRYGTNFAARVKDWSRATAESQRLADEAAAWAELAAREPEAALALVKPL